MTARRTPQAQPRTADAGVGLDGTRAAVELVVCVGGPLDGRWYTAQDWQVARDAAKRMRQVMGRSDRCPRLVLGYRQSTESRPHPDPRRWPPGRVWIPVQPATGPARVGSGR